MLDVDLSSAFGADFLAFDFIIFVQSCAAHFKYKKAG